MESRVFRSGRYTARKNDNISMLYIIYQSVLFGSSILGPATIFLLVVGSVDSVFQIGLGVAIIIGIIPLILFMITCFRCSNNTQVQFAAVLSAVTAVLQTFVMVGLVRQMVDNGVCSPQSFFFLFVMGVFVLAAILHPQVQLNSSFHYIPTDFSVIHVRLFVLTGRNEFVLHSNLLPVRAEHVPHSHDLLALQHQQCFLGNSRD